MPGPERRNRLMNLDIAETQISITGNMKFDNIVTAISEDTEIGYYPYSI